MIDKPKPAGDLAAVLAPPPASICEHHWVVEIGYGPRGHGASWCTKCNAQNPTTAAVLASPPANGWQPIETYPKETAPWVQLGWFELPAQDMQQVGFWHSHKKAFCDTHHVLHNQQSSPTHWHALLSPPGAVLASPHLSTEEKEQEDSSRVDRHGHVRKPGTTA